MMASLTRPSGRSLDVLAGLVLAGGAFWFLAVLPALMRG